MGRGKRNEVSGKRLEERNNRGKVGTKKSVGRGWRKDITGVRREERSKWEEAGGKK